MKPAQQSDDPGARIRKQGSWFSVGWQAKGESWLNKTRDS